MAFLGCVNLHLRLHFLVHLLGNNAGWEWLRSLLWVLNYHHHYGRFAHWTWNLFLNEWRNHHMAVTEDNRFSLIFPHPWPFHSGPLAIKQSSVPPNSRLTTAPQTWNSYTALHTCSYNVCTGFYSCQTFKAEVRQCYATLRLCVPIGRGFCG